MSVSADSYWLKSPPVQVQAPGEGPSSYGLQRGENQRCPSKRHARRPAQEIKGIDGRLRHSINDVTDRGVPSLRIYRYRQAGAGHGATHSQEGRSGEGGMVSARLQRPKPSVSARASAWVHNGTNNPVFRAFCAPILILVANPDAAFPVSLFFFSFPSPTLASW